MFESIEGSVCALGTKHLYFTTSFYYPPHEQYYALEEDSENQIKRDVLNDKKYSVSNSDDGDVGEKYSDDRLSYVISISPQGVLRIDYTLYGSADVTIGLYDLQGRQLSNLQRLQCAEGSYTETLSLSDFPDGEYLLRLTINGKAYGEKVLKR